MNLASPGYLRQPLKGERPASDTHKGGGECACDADASGGSFWRKGAPAGGRRGSAASATLLEILCFVIVTQCLGVAAHAPD